MSESLIHSDADLEEVRAHARWLEERAVMLQRENDRLRARIRELEAEKDAASIMPWIKRWKERAEKAEAERDALKALANQYLGWHKECEAERDTIARAIEEMCKIFQDKYDELGVPAECLSHFNEVLEPGRKVLANRKSTQPISEPYDLGGEGAGDEP